MRSARISLATPSGRERRRSTAGARRRDQRKVPSAIALPAERCEDSSNARSASSEERPSKTTDETARAASAKAAAPGAQRERSAKSTPCQVESVHEIAGGYGSFAGALKLIQSEPPVTAGDNDGVAAQVDDLAGGVGRAGASGTGCPVASKRLGLASAKWPGRHTAAAGRAGRHAAASSRVGRDVTACRQGRHAAASSVW